MWMLIIICNSRSRAVLLEGSFNGTAFLFLQTINQLALMN